MPRPPISIKYIKEFIEENNGNCTLLSTKYENIHAHLIFKCECGEIYECSWTHVQQTLKMQCNKCGHKRGAKKQEYPFDYLKEIVEKETGNKLIDSKRKCRDLIVETPEGYRYLTDIYNVKNHCQPKLFESRNPYTIYNVKLFIKLNNICLEILNEDNEFTNSKEFKFSCKCKCGNIYSATLFQIIYGNRYRCPKCVNKISNLELTVLKYLQSLNLKIETQKTFEECKVKRKLRFDFYLPDYNTVIEVNGNQHYYDNPLFFRKLEEQQKYDNIKKQYCKDNNINFLEIPFWKIENNKENPSFKKDIDKILNRT